MNNGTPGVPTATGHLSVDDPDGADTFVAVTTPTNSSLGLGRYTITAAGDWTYVLNDTNSLVQALGAGDQIADRFTVRSADGTTQLVSVTIQGADDNPVAKADAAFVAAGGTVSIDVLGNDTDPEHGALAIAAVGEAAHGTVSISGGRITYTPNSSYSGPDTFNYTVRDPTGLESSAAVSVIIGVANHAQVGGDTFLQGNYMEMGVSAAGSLGSANAAPSGYHPHGVAGATGGISYVVDLDGFSTGAPATAGDFTLPGTPEDAMVVGFNGRNYVQDERVGGLNDLHTSTTDTSAGGRLQSTTIGTADGLSYRQVINLDPNATYYTTTITLTNTSAAVMTDVRFMRSFDPDQDYDRYGAFSTQNDVLTNPSAGHDLAIVQALGINSGVSVNLVALDPRAVASNFGFTNHNVYAAAAFDTPVDGNGHYADEAITVGARFGNLAPGAQVSFTYYTSLNGHAGANDMVIGSGASETLNGGGGDDIIFGLGGNDTLTGNIGNDLFVFAKGLTGATTITDFSAGAGTDDVIQLRGFGFQDFNEVRTHSVEDSGGLTIDLGAGEHIRLSGVALSALHPDDVLLV
ncbi:VCBS domain-containing protein [Micromonospora sp. STR1s_5]|nr:VCBS domain-containing protein [Micromonospora sp. STR1s_5]